MAILKRITLLCAALLLSGSSALGEAVPPPIDGRNAEAFGRLLTGLVQAYEAPSASDDDAIDAALADIRSVSEADGLLASAIAEHWRAVYLNPDYALHCMEKGATEATALAGSAIPDSPGHAFVVLGFKLLDGEMTNELRGRCRAAAAAARSFPETWLICSGGATGSNNPQHHTEGGLMKDFLVKRCGIAPERILTDEKAMTTLDNARKTFEILESHGIGTITVVTSSYHQRWGQMVYLAMSALNRNRGGYSVEIIDNYCYETKAPETYQHDDRFAANQIAELLELPAEVTSAMRKAFRRIRP